MLYLLDGIVQERAAILLGVYLSANLSFDEHVNFLDCLFSANTLCLKKYI